MKNCISIIAAFILIIAIISCGGGNKETAENTQTNQVYINPTTTNNTDIDINFDTTKYTNEYIQGIQILILTLIQLNILMNIFKVQKKIL